MDALIADLRCALRALRRSPGFTCVAVLTLALGIGANTAMFSVVNAVLLASPPFKDPDRLVLITARAAWADGPLPLSYPNYTDLRDQTNALQRVGAWASYTDNTFSLTGGCPPAAGGCAPERVQYALATSSLFPLLGTDAYLGRTFTAAEDRFGNGDRVALVSYGLWRQRFGGDPALVGKSVDLDGNPYTVVGVLPPQFNFVAFPRTPEVWLPLGLDPADQHRHYARSVEYLGVLGRLASGVTIAQAQTDIATIGRRLAQQYPRDNPDFSLHAVPLHAAAVGAVRPALLVLLGAVGLVLLIACANMANLLLARATTREQEMAIRLALGASGGRLVRQLLTESVLLALLGGTLGIVVALWSVHLLGLLPAMFGPPSPLTPYTLGGARIHIDMRVLLFAVVISLATGVLFGLTPALQSARPNLNSMIGSGARAGTGSRGKRVRGLLVIGEIALAFTLLTGGGLLIRSFARLTQTDPGFRADHVLTFALSLPPSKYDTPERVAAFYAELLSHVTTLPGVRAGGAVTQLPLTGPEVASDFRVAGRTPPEEGHAPVVPYTRISAGYFRAMGIALVAGRGIGDRDDARAPRVAVINESMARQYWPGENPVGKRFTLAVEALHVDQTTHRVSFDWQGASREVVGVVRDVHHAGLGAAPAPEVYISYEQYPARSMALALRTSSDPTTLAGAIRRVVSALDSDLSVDPMETMDAIVSTSVGAPRFRMLLLGTFAALAALLAVVGLYGMMSYAVNRRTREIGIRLALGAAPRDMIRLMVQEGMTLAGAGLALGVAGSMAGSRLLSGLLFGVNPTDVVTFTAVTILLTVVALVACYLPARRVTRVNPAAVLSVE